MVSSAIAGVLLCAGVAAGQQHLRLDGFVPGGMRSTATEGWSKLDFTVTNPTETDRKALVLAFYANSPDVQFGREVWVPGHATLASWLPLGPAPVQAGSMTREIQMLLHEVADDAGRRLVLPPTEERIRSRGVIYRKREEATALVADVELESGSRDGQLPQPDSPDEEALSLARAFRAAQGLSEHVENVDPDALPGWFKAFDGVDHVILASTHLGREPAGMRALRQWVEHGGVAWVMLDRVDPRVVQWFLGEACDFSVVDRVSLTDFRIEEPAMEPGTARRPMQKHDRPVAFTRVVLPPGEPVQHTIDGWPVWFTRALGRGKVLFTTLGARGWYRPRTSRDPQSPLPHFPALPVTDDLLIQATAMFPVRAAPAFPVAPVEKLLSEEIGYSVVGRGTAGLVFALFLVGVLGLSVLANRMRRLELRGCAGPAAALAAALALVTLGYQSRGAAPPTVAFVQVVDAVADSKEVAVHGMLAVYQPDSGPARLAASGQGFFDLDLAGTEGQTRRLVMTDLGAWHWENIVLPAGVRFAPFQFTTEIAEPLAAVATFGPDGLEGAVRAELFANLADGLVTVPGARPLAARFGPGARLACRSDDTLPAGQFLAGTLLSDRQQRRQEIYRELLEAKGSAASDRGPVLLAWADAVPMPFRLASDTRMAGTALLALPLRLERPAPGARVTIPGSFVQLRQLRDGRPGGLTRESGQATELHLRFQLPPAVLPLHVERARLLGRVDAPSRRVTVAGWADGALVEFHKFEEPRGPFQLDVTDERLLRPDAEGSIHLILKVGDRQAASAKADVAWNWTVEYLELEVSGRTLP
jgi:hypothetical protein